LKLLPIPLLALLLCSLQAYPAGKQQPDLRPLSPNDSVIAAAADAASIADPDIRYATRYLSLHHIPAAERAAYMQTLDFILNSLSRRRAISYAQTVNGSNGAVVRIFLDSYGINATAFENLAIRGSGPVRISTKRDQPEEYFATRKGETKKVTKQRQKKDAQGRLLFYDAGTPRETPALEDYTEEVKTFSGSWFDPAAMLALQTAVKSEYPIIRADWFIANASLAPAYYELLGIKTHADFQELVRYRERDYDLSTKGIVTDSAEVSLHNRAILVTPTALGRYWETFDYLTSQGDDNLLRDLVKRRRDAGEAFAEMPNGMQAFLLIDGKDKVLDVADGNIVSDQTTPWRHKLVFGGLAQCTMCHVDGAKDVHEEVRLSTKPPFGLQIPTTEKQKAREVADLFFSGNVDDPIAQTRLVYRQRIALATRGHTPEQNTLAFKKAFLDFWQKPLTLADAAAEVGCTPADFARVMGALKAPAPEPGIATLLQGRTLRREIWTDGALQQSSTIFYQLRRVKP